MPERLRLCAGRIRLEGDLERAGTPLDTTERGSVDEGRARGTISVAV